MLLPLKGRVLTHGTKDMESIWLFTIRLVFMLAQASTSHI